MKQLINGMIFDTHTATELIHVKSGGNYSYRGYHFYKTQKGRLFKEEVWFGCASYDGRLSETNEIEMYKILVDFNTPIETIKALCPSINIEVA